LSAGKCQAFQEVVAAPGPVLTPAEKRVATLLLKGLSDREIAEVLNITRATVNIYFRHLHEKFAISEVFHKRVRLAILLHQFRRDYGIPCQACGET
jgi:DNA-binding CsgD family transcriptional regulator